MGNLFKRVSAMAGARRNERSIYAHIPLFASRGAIRARLETKHSKFCARSFAPPALQSIVQLLIIVISMMPMAKPSLASGNVPPVFASCSNYLYQNAWTGYEQGGFATAAAACGSLGVGAYVSNGNYYCASSNWHRALCMAPVYSCPDHSTGTAAANPAPCTCNDPYVPSPSGASCVAPTAPACPTNMSGAPCTCNSGYVPDQNGPGCVLPACPSHAHRETPGASCVCDANFKWNDDGTSCVPNCPESMLDEITDPVANRYEDGTYSTTNPDIEHLTSATQTGLACIKQKVIATKCYQTPQATSGYRPAAYQKHIYDVYYKWQKIKNNNTPECAEVKAAIKKQFDAHSPFKHAPGETSNHSRTDAQGNPAGNAADIAFVPDNALISADAIACQCNMARTVPNDSVHYQPRACPR